VPEDASTRGRKVLISSFRNEAPFVLEFVAHHKVLGFDEIIIASNDCTDGTDAILQALDWMGVIHHVPCTPPGGTAPQSFAYAEIRRQWHLDSASWLMVLDADELLNIHVGAGRLEDLLAAQEPGVDLVLVNWASFGADGHARWIDQPSTTRFVHRLRTLSSDGLVKSLIRGPTRWKTLSNHHPFGCSDQAPVRIAFAGGLWVQDVPAEAMVFGAHRFVRPRLGTFRMAQVNHYATRTEDSFALRQARGRGAMPRVRPRATGNDRHTPEYFRRMSSGTFLDDTILRYQAEVATLTAQYLTNAGLKAAVATGLNHYAAAIARYWQDH
jgi:hypothetical protein